MVTIKFSFNAERQQWEVELNIDGEIIKNYFDTEDEARAFATAVLCKKPE
jgi:hypothetical protein